MNIMTKRILDVSSHQDGLDLSQVDYDGVIVKATEGTGYVNPVCDRHYQQAKDAGKLLGTYHFAGNSVEGRLLDPRAEAEHYARHTEGYVGQGIFVLDFEVETSRVDWAHEWVNRFRELTGVNPMIYMSESVVLSHDWSALTDCGLWVAKYRDYAFDYNWNMDTAGNPPALAHWPFYAMWQWTSSGRLNGYFGNLDLNLFYGNEGEWGAYAAVNGNLPTPTPDPAPAPAPVPNPGTTYVVRSGDTLSDIAARHGTTWQHLASINGLSNPDLIFPGQVLRVTGENRTEVYIVSSGDTLSGIAARFGTNWQTLARINGLSNPDIIFPGQVLRLT